MSGNVAMARLLHLLVWLSCVSSAAISVGIVGAAEENAAPFRIGFSSAMFTDVNENDVRAAIRIWGEQIGRARDVPIDPDPLLFRNVDAMILGLEQGRVDAVGILTLEYHRLRRHFDFSPLFLTYHSGTFTEEYLVLAHRDGSVKTLDDLDGRRLAVHDNPRVSLAPQWLDMLLHRRGHPPAARFAGRIETNTKLSQVVLPVFFRRMDACLVTRNGFATMCELNPQVAQQVIILAESPPVVPALFAFRSDYRSPYKSDVLVGLNELKNSPAGQQVLTIFFSEDVAEKPVSILDATLELIEAHERIEKLESVP
jgi:ABC-type phosphate/phosphonate transport system substrate-binding protein